MYGDVLAARQKREVVEKNGCFDIIRYLTLSVLVETFHRYYAQIRLF